MVLTRRATMLSVAKTMAEAEASDVDAAMAVAVTCVGEPSGFRT